MTGNYSFVEGNSKENLSYLGWPPLAERRAKAKLITLFKARQGVIDLPLDDLTPVGRTTRNSDLKFRIPQSSVDSHLHSFISSTIRLWNNLPQHTKACNTVASFKSNICYLTLSSAYN